jgi:hypothetical protein
MALMMIRDKTKIRTDAIITPSMLASKYFKKLLMIKKLNLKLNNISKSHVLEQELFIYA